MIVTFILKALSWVVLQIFSVVTPVMPEAVTTAFTWALNQAISGIGILGLFLDLKFCAGVMGFWLSLRAVLIVVDIVVWVVGLINGRLSSESED